MKQVRARVVTARTGVVALTAALLAGVLASVVGATPASAAVATVNNTAKITIPGTGTATPSPSIIHVAGLGSTISGMKVVLKNVNHTCVRDLDVLLVAPDGTRTVLFSDNGQAWKKKQRNCTNLIKDQVTIDDTCADFGEAVPGGEASTAPICVRPSDNDSAGHEPDSWTGVSGTPSALNLATFTGKNPNGDWKLYVKDDGNSNDKGSIDGGWELQLDTPGPVNGAPVATPQVVTAYKGTAVDVSLEGTDPDGDALSCIVPPTTAQGKGALGGSGCDRTFTASARTTGTDSFAFRVADPKGAQSTNAVVVFNITNRPPVANTINLTVGRNERTAITLGGTDPDAGEGLAVTCSPTLGATALGSVTGSGCNVTYAAKNTNGADSFEFLINDGFGGVAAGTVNITVVDPDLPGCTSTDTKNARYVCRVYLDLLGRAADPGGKAFWLRKVDAGEPRVGIIRKYQTTKEYNRRVVDDVYKTFLKRNPDSGGQTYWAEKLRTGANPDAIRTQVIGSNEYYTKAGASSAGFAAAIYQQVTRIPATKAQVDAVVNQIRAGKTRTSIAAALLATPAGDTATVQGIYERYLRRTPPSSEITYWVNKLQAGVTELKIVEATVASNEYYNRS